MKLKLFLVCLLNGMQLLATPLIQRIINNSNIGFVILEHSDVSSCSLAKRGAIIDAGAIFKHDILLDMGKPSLVLRPIYFLNPQTKEKIMLVNESFEYVPDQVARAYAAWKQSMKIKKFKNAPNWLSWWVGEDISIFPQEVEIFGYLINLSRVKILNRRHYHSYWLSFSKGIFSKLLIDLEIQQHGRKGIKPVMHVLHGEGGVCLDGIVDRL